MLWPNSASAVDFCGALTFDEQIELIGAEVFMNIRYAGRPTNLNSFNLSGATQHKVQAQIAPSDPALAQKLIATAQAIIDALSG